MNRLAYQLITDKRVRRQIDILSILSATKAPVTLEELSDEIMISERTIAEDIKDLISKLPQGVELVVFPKVGAVLNWKTSYLLSDFISEISENNPIFEIVENLFHGVEENVEEYADRLFISDITLKRKLIILKKELKKFKLGLQFSPLRITGNEINIRCFFFSYFRNISNHSFMIPHKNQVNVHDGVVNKLKSMEEGSLYSDYRRAMQWLIIVEQRIKAEKFVKLPDVLIEKQVVKQSYSRFKKIFVEQLSSSLDISDLIEDEIVFAYFVRLDTIVYNYADTTKFVMMYEEEIPLTIMEPFIAKILSTFNIDIEKSEGLELIIKAFMSNLYLIGKLSSLFQKNSFELNHKIKQLHPFTHSKCLDILTSTGVDKKLSIEYVTDVAVSLSLIISSYMYDINLKEKKILFALSGESTYVNYFMMISNCFLPRNIELLFSFNEEITASFLKKNKIDLWVHNYPIQQKIDGVVSFQISNIPSIDEWTLLIKLIVDISPEELHQFFDSNSENIIVV